MDVMVIIFALVLFTVLAFKGVSAVIMGPLVGLLIAFMAGLPVYDTVLGPFMSQAAKYVQSYFLVFLLGALFGVVYEQTGAAKSIAVTIVKSSKGKFAASIIFIITSILTFGGISGFVVFFVMYPIALQLFRENNITRRILPGAISAGSWTISMIAPGSPSIQNVIGERSLGTTATAAFLPGMVAVLVEFVLIVLWLEWRTKATQKKGQIFDDPTLTPLPEHELGENLDRSKLPNFWLAMIPIFSIIFLFNFDRMVSAFGLAHMIPALSSVHFPVETAVLIGVLLALAFFWNRLPGSGLSRITIPMNRGGANGVSAIMNTALVVGFGGVVQKTAGFKQIVDFMLHLNISPLWFVAIAVAICAGATGSASGGMTIAFEALKDTFTHLGVNMEYVHRIGVVAAGTLDTLPHQGAQITLLNLCHLTHREGYLDIAITQIIIPIIALCIMIPLCQMGL